MFGRSTGPNYKYTPSTALESKSSDNELGNFIHSDGTRRDAGVAIDYRLVPRIIVFVCACPIVLRTSSLYTPGHQHRST